MLKKNKVCSERRMRRNRRGKRKEKVMKQEVWTAG